MNYLRLTVAYITYTIRWRREILIQIYIIEVMYSFCREYKNKKGHLKINLLQFRKVIIYHLLSNKKFTVKNHNISMFFIHLRESQQGML